MSKKLKIIVSLVIIALISAPMFFKKEEATISTTNSKYCGVNTSIIDIKNGNVVYIKCKVKNAGTLGNTLDKHGISAILSALMFRKINGLSPEETREKMIELGLRNFSINALGSDFEISFCLLKNNAKNALSFISNSFLMPDFSESDLEFTKEIFPKILDIDTSNPEALIFEKLMNMLYGNHPYGLNKTGTARAISSLTVEDIKEFVKTYFVKSNLEITIAGDISRFDANAFVETMLSKIPEEKAPEINKTLPSLPEEKFAVIHKPDMKDIVGIICGIRLDDLTDIERAAAYIIMNTLFNSENGNFSSGLRQRNIAYNANCSWRKEELSTAFYISIFIEKKDLQNYKNYIDEKMSMYGRRLNLKNLERTKKSFIAESEVGFTDLINIDKKMERCSLPFVEVNQPIFEKVAKKLFNKSQMRVVIIGDNTAVNPQK